MANVAGIYCGMCSFDTLPKVQLKLLHQIEKIQITFVAYDFFVFVFNIQLTKALEMTTLSEILRRGGEYLRNRVACSKKAIMQESVAVRYSLVLST